MSTTQPWPAKRHVPGLRRCHDPELPQASAAKLFLQFGAPHEGHAAHFHRAPDHSRRVAELFPSDSLGRARLFPQIRFSVCAGHFPGNFLSPSMRKIFGISRKERGNCELFPYHNLPATVDWCTTELTPVDGVESVPFAPEISPKRICAIARQTSCNIINVTAYEGGIKNDGRIL